MLTLIFLSVFLALGVNGEVEVKDYGRACPEGFSYFGEVDIQENERNFWVEGEKSPTYSCYSLHLGITNWTAASQQCMEQEGGQLVSVNNLHEAAILTGAKAAEVLGATDRALSSGISLRPGQWTWFGAGVEVAANLSVEAGEVTSEDTQCLELRWTQVEEQHGNLTVNTTQLLYSAVSCYASASPALLCEVRVYTQTWWYWTTTNWLSILFLFTLVLLIISACVTVQMYTSRPRVRQGRAVVGVAEVGGAPPPYSAQPQAQGTGYPTKTPAATGTRTTATRYAEKGREMLAKIVFIK